jgi:ATP-dependent RNA helicase DHX57
MSTVVEGKDTIKFVDEEQINQAATSSKPEEKKETEEEPASAFNPETGEINWDCPCKCLLQYQEIATEMNSM